jgi:hypothetical protein
MGNKEPLSMIPPSPSVDVEVLERTDEYVVAAWRRLLMLVWRGDATALGIERSRALFDEWSKTKPGGAAFLIVFPNRRPEPPDEKTREAMQRTARFPAERLKGMATLFESEGFIAASIRAVMMRLAALSGQDVPNTFGNATTAAAWAAMRLSDPTITALKLNEAINVARKH